MDAMTAVERKAGRARIAMLVALVILAGGVSVASARGRMRASALVAPHVADTACAAFLPYLKPESKATDAQRDSAFACVRRVDSALRWRADSTVSEDLRLPRAYYQIPEYHDEQRLLAERDGETVVLGPKAGIYASGYLGAFTSEWQYAEHLDTGVFVAHVYVERDGTAELPATYQALGLDAGLNCVWLVHRYPVPNDTWTAYVRPARNDMCDPKYGTKTELLVKRTRLAGANADLYPAVARFGETTKGEPLLGVKCLAGWCEMGTKSEPGNWEPRRPLVTMHPEWGVANARARVKGWHDEQVLSVKDAAGRWVQSSTRAAVVPTEGLDLAPVDFSQWRRVATIYLDANPPAGSKYSGWGLARGANVLQLRRDLPAGVAEGESSGRWHARITRGVFLKDWKVMDRCVHRDVVVPGTARFRWTILDDGIWAPCGQACCQVQGDE